MIQEMIALLYGKDTSEGFQNLKKLEAISEKENTLYPFIDEWIAMLKSEQYVIRVRGFRMLCKQAKWDVENKIEAVIDQILQSLDDEKPTAVRQYLKYIQEIVTYKPNLNDKIKEKLKHLDYMKYKESMQGLITKDIDEVMTLITSYH